MRNSLLANEPNRRLEARITHHLVDQHRPYGEQPSQAPPLTLKKLARLERLGERELAAAHLVHSQGTQARAVLESRARDTANPPTADDLNDLAVVALQEGAFAKALGLLDSALEQRPGHPQALWNRALVLKKLDLPLLAAEMFGEVALLKEAGWSTEARAQVERLIQDANERKKVWEGISSALKTPGDLDKLIASPELAARLPGTARAIFYKAIRSRTSREEVEKLLPLARVLDRHQGDDALESYVRQVAQSDFSQRAPLARDYALLIRRELPDADGFLEKLAATSERDIYLGALLNLQIPPAHGGNFQTLFQESGDPWLRMALWMHQPPEEDAKAEELLKSEYERCDEALFAYRCLGFAKELTDRSIGSAKLADAQAYATHGLKLARSAGEWEFERVFLQQLGRIAMLRYDRSLSRAYLQEALARDPEQCAYVYEHMAALAMLDFKMEEAREQMDTALQCGTSLTGFGAYFLAVFAGFDASSSRQEQFRGVLDELRRASLSPEDEAWLLFVEGQFELEVDQASGRDLLNDAIEAAERLQDPEDVRYVREHAYSTLIIDAGRAEEGDRVLDLVARSRGIPKPEQCVVVVEDDHTRLITLVLGPRPHSKPVLHAQENRTGPIGSGAGLISGSDLEELKGCEQVHVLGSNSVLGSAELLPMELAWSFQLPRQTRASFQPGKRLMVYNVEPPKHLKLPILPAKNGPSSGSPDVGLSAADATPSRVLDELPQASEIEIHAHGLFLPDLYDTPFIALTPDSHKQYALTGEMISKQKLERAPVVFLAACGTARRHPLSHKPPSGLPTAFIYAGASAVLAATTEVPNSVGQFFEGVGARVRKGTPPAVALRDERREWLAKLPPTRQAGAQQGRQTVWTQGPSQEGWLKHVLIYE